MLNAYLRSCLMVSLRKRWGSVVLLALVAGLAFVVLGGSLVSALAGAVLGAVLSSAWIAVSSYLRHRDDAPARSSP